MKVKTFEDPTIISVLTLPINSNLLRIPGDIFAVIDPTVLAPVAKVIVTF